MYKVLLVDDEPWILEDMKEMTCFAERGFNICGVALNGDEALEKVYNLRPDLVISDIRMPFLNGLELITKINEFDDNILTIFVSAYSEFEYAQIALRKGAFDYLLKPIDEEQLSNVLIKVSETINKRQTKEGKTILFENTEKLLKIIENPNDDKQSNAYKQEIGFKGDLNLFVLFIKILDGITENTLWFDNILKKQEFIFSTAYIGLGQYLFIIETSYSDEYLQKYLREQCDFGSDNLRIQLGISKSFCSFADIKSAYREAKHAILDSFILGSKMIYKHNDGNDEKLSEIVQKISSITSLIQLRAILENIINDINNYLSLNIDNCCKLHNEIRMQFKRLTNKNDYFEYLVPDSIISNYESFVDMLKSFIEQIDLDNGRGNTNISSKLLKEILNYINENFEKKIQLFAIAKMFFINPNYLSQLFKTNLNTSFTDYVTNLKIEKAKQLIENSDLTMCEISEQVGYDDYFHFSKVFKKKMDVSPSSFKKNKIN